MAVLDPHHEVAKRGRLPFFFIGFLMRRGTLQRRLFGRSSARHTAAVEIGVNELGKPGGLMIGCRAVFSLLFSSFPLLSCNNDTVTRASSSQVVINVSLPDIHT
jgi:hypothetical protein